MSDPSTSDRRANKNARQVEYVPPDQKVIRTFAYNVCASLRADHPACADQEVVTGLTSFLEFIARTSARYLSKGHETYLLSDYVKPKKGKGGHHGEKETITTSAA